MPLPSQIARPTARRSHMYRRRRRNRKLLLAVLVAAAVAVGWWALWPDGHAGDDTAANDLASLQTRLDAVDDTPPAVRSPLDPPTHRPADDTRTERNPSEERDADRSSPMASVTSTLVMGEPIDADNARTESPARATERSDTWRQPADVPDDAADSSSIAEDTTPTFNDRAPGSAGTTGQRLVQQGKALIDTRPVDARLMLSQAMRTGDLTPIEMQDVRNTLSKLNRTLVFSPQLVPGDPYAIDYTVQGDDLLQKIVRRMSLQVDWRFISRINRVDPRRIRAGQSLKLITGPFHAVVDKSEFRMDLYLGDGPEQVYVCSFPVGLGQYNSTPEGLFRVRPRSKAVNPAWVNPRTGEAFDANDPDNPIGEYWIGLEGVDPSLKDVSGYGIHGTTEPESIGSEASMGCIRLGDDDVALVYEVLVEEASLVRIVP